MSVCDFIVISCFIQCSSNSFSKQCFPCRRIQGNLIILLVWIDSNRLSTSNLKQFLIMWIDCFECIFYVCNIVRIIYVGPMKCITKGQLNLSFLHVLAIQFSNKKTYTQNLYNIENNTNSARSHCNRIPWSSKINGQFTVVNKVSIWFGDRMVDIAIVATTTPNHTKVWIFPGKSQHDIDIYHRLNTTVNGFRTSFNNERGEQVNKHRRNASVV